MTPLEQKLTKFFKEHDWLPGGLENTLQASWHTDENLQMEIDRVIPMIGRLPNDGSVGSLLPNEKAFYKEFS